VLWMLHTWVEVSGFPVSTNYTLLVGQLGSREKKEQAVLSYCLQ
jgi:hypothetical protein